MMNTGTTLPYFKTYPRLLQEKRFHDLSPEAFKVWTYMMCYMNDRTVSGWELEEYVNRPDGEARESTGVGQAEIGWYMHRPNGISEEVLKELEEANMITVDEDGTINLSDWEKTNIRVFSKDGKLLNDRQLRRAKQKPTDEQE